MQVYLLSGTPDPDGLVAAAARICYSDATASDLLKRESAALSARLLADLRLSGHLSPFEHASFTFGVDGLSRVASHQLVRHRVASFSQQSQRYVKMGGSEDSLDIVIPPTVAGNPEAVKLFTRQAEDACETYKKMVSMGIPAEDARFILPHGWETRLVLTMNARELHHFFELRLCRRAQWEIRELARLMLTECRNAAPVIFETAGPSCVSGECRESRSCGRPYGGMEDLLAKDECE
jgi:thymidylate synthase (FAD)